jgi:hypothetical protein
MLGHTGADNSLVPTGTEVGAGLHWFRLPCAVLPWFGLPCAVLVCAALVWPAMCFAVLLWAALGWARLGLCWAGLCCPVLCWSVLLWFALVWDWLGCPGLGCRTPVAGLQCRRTGSLLARSRSVPITGSTLTQYWSNMTVGAVPSAAKILTFWPCPFSNMDFMPALRPQLLMDWKHRICLPKYIRHLGNITSTWGSCLPKCRKCIWFSPSCLPEGRLSWFVHNSCIGYLDVAWHTRRQATRHPVTYFLLKSTGICY